MSSPTRKVILRTMRTQGSCTVKELAEAAEVSPVSVRHHLAALQADDLVAAEEIKHGVGRPYHSFSLTEKGQDVYPGRYFSLTNKLLDEIKDHISEDLVIELFSGVASTMAAKYAERLEGLPLDERLPLLMDLLAEEGFEAEYERKDDQVIIRETGCPYINVGREHPEVCVVDTRFIATTLNVPAERIHCVLDGDAHCTFTFPIEQQKEELAV